MRRGAHAILSEGDDLPTLVVLAVTCLGGAGRNIQRSLPQKCPATLQAIPFRPRLVQRYVDTIKGYPSPPFEDYETHIF